MSPPPRASTNAGSYVLLIRLDQARMIAAGRRPRQRFPAGYYAYVGSALNGLRTRLERHLREDKRLHWHIDYLLREAQIVDIVTCRSQERTECAIAAALAERFDTVAGFGASDCRCRSHLFRDGGKMKAAVTAALRELSLEPKAMPAE
ncbi:MAG: GIY-YIG nuclease family protein [Dehalococcoidales bacterium]